MSEPLLSIRGLVMRFGGLLAVEAFDLDVKEGEIIALIGPNGAGKTTVFNTVSGIYPPTSGSIRFRGRDLKSELRPRTVLSWIAAGLVVALLLLLFVSDVDGLWSAAVKQNNTQGKNGFPIRKALADGLGHIAAEPRLELRTGLFYIIGPDGRALPGFSKTASDAAGRLARLTEIGRLGAVGTTIESSGEGFVITTLDHARVLEHAATSEQAWEISRMAQAVISSTASERRKRVIVFVLGFLLGAAGSAAVWSRSRWMPPRIAQKGIARTFQNTRLFPKMTVLENLLVGMHHHIKLPPAEFLSSGVAAFGPPAVILFLLALLSAGLRGAWLSSAPAAALLAGCLILSIAYLIWIARLRVFSPSGRRLEENARKEAAEILSFVGLDSVSERTADELAYGSRRRLEIARALAAHPILLLLDEPAAGMNPSETDAIMKLIRKIRDRGVTVFLIEHDMRLVMGISDRIAVLQYGRKIAEGSPEQVRGDARVIEAYLGREAGN